MSASLGRASPAARRGRECEPSPAFNLMEPGERRIQTGRFSRRRPDAHSRLRTNAGHRIPGRAMSGFENKGRGTRPMSARIWADDGLRDGQSQRRGAATRILIDKLLGAAPGRSGFGHADQVAQRGGPRPSVFVPSTKQRADWGVAIDTVAPAIRIGISFRCSRSSTISSCLLHGGNRPGIAAFRRVARERGGSG